jgi:hypothetical protein
MRYTEADPDTHIKLKKKKTKGTNKSPFLISGGKLDILYFE